MRVSLARISLTASCDVAPFMGLTHMHSVLAQVDSLLSFELIGIWSDMLTGAVLSIQTYHVNVTTVWANQRREYAGLISRSCSRILSYRSMRAWNLFLAYMMLYAKRKPSVHSTVWFVMKQVLPYSVWYNCSTCAHLYRHCCTSLETVGCVDCCPLLKAGGKEKLKEKNQKKHEVDTTTGTAVQAVWNNLLL